MARCDLENYIQPSVSTPFGQKVHVALPEASNLSAAENKVKVDLTTNFHFHILQISQSKHVAYTASTSAGTS